MEKPCDYHHQICEDLAIIKHDMTFMREKFAKHVDDGEKPFGYRDRLLICEGEMKTIKQEILRLNTEVWKVGIIAGLIGSLVGQLTPELVKVLINLLAR